MDAELYDNLYVPTDPEEQKRIHLKVLRRWIELIPEAAEEATKKAAEKAVEKAVQQRTQHQFERRLKRLLTPVEQAVLLQRFETLGADRLDDVVLDLDASALSAWLADPAAR